MNCGHFRQTTAVGPLPCATPGCAEYARGDKLIQADVATGKEHVFEKVQWAYVRDIPEGRHVFITVCWLPEGEDKYTYFDTAELERYGDDWGPAPVRGGTP
jgi:hypothetical protein